MLQYASGNKPTRSQIALRLFRLLGTSLIRSVIFFLTIICFLYLLDVLAEAAYAGNRWAIAVLILGANLLGTLLILAIGSRNKKRQAMNLP